MSSAPGNLELSHKQLIGGCKLHGSRWHHLGLMRRVAAWVRKWLNGLRGLRSSNQIVKKFSISRYIILMSDGQHLRNVQFIHFSRMQNINIIIPNFCAGCLCILINFPTSRPLLPFLDRLTGDCSAAFSEVQNNLQPVA